MNTPSVKDFSDSFQFAQYYNIIEKNLDFATAKGEDWSKWRKWIELSNYEKIGINQRGILQNEIVFDIENKTEHVPLMKLLEMEGFFFSTWDTGGKGTHTHLYFDKNLSSKEKLFFLKRVQTAIKISLDESSAKGRRLIGIELGFHRKTGKQKTLIKENRGLELNKFPKMPVEEPTIPIIRHFGPANPTDCLPLIYATKNKIPEGNRHLILSKNFAIWTIHHSNREALRKAYLEIQEMPPTDLYGWDKAIEENKISKVNCAELEKFFDSFGRRDVVVLCRSLGRCSK